MSATSGGNMTASSGWTLLINALVKDKEKNYVTTFQFFFSHEWIFFVSSDTTTLSTGSLGKQIFEGNHSDVSHETAMDWDVT